MEIINRDHVRLKPRYIANSTVAISMDGITFNYNTVIEMQLFEGVLIEFAFEVDRLYVFKSDNTGKAFAPRKCKKFGKNLRLIIHSRSLVNYLQSTNSGIKFKNYTIKKTNSEMNGHVLFEILLHKKVKK